MPFGGQKRSLDIYSYSIIRYFIGVFIICINFVCIFIGSTQMFMRYTATQHYLDLFLHIQSKIDEYHKILSELPIKLNYV